MKRSCNQQPAEVYPGTHKLRPVLDAAVKEASETDYDMDAFYKYLRAHEGENLGLHGAEGDPTVGVGHSLRDGSREIFQNLFADQVDFDQVMAGQQRLTPDQSRRLFDHDVQRHLQRVERKVPAFPTLPVHRQKAILSAAYRGDWGPRTISHINAGQWDAAAKEYLNHEGYRTAEERGLSGIRNRMEQNSALLARATAQPAAAPAATTYVVQPGDTLSAISKSHFGDPSRYSEIAKLNQLADPNKIKPGQELKMPQMSKSNVDLSTRLVKSAKRMSTLFTPTPAYSDGVVNTFMSDPSEANRAELQKILDFQESTGVYNTDKALAFQSSRDDVLRKLMSRLRRYTPAEPAQPVRVKADSVPLDVVWDDELDLSSFATDIQDEYGIQPPSVWRDDATLNEIADELIKLRDQFHQRQSTKQASLGNIGTGALAGGLGVGGLAALLGREEDEGLSDMLRRGLAYGGLGATLGGAAGHLLNKYREGQGGAPEPSAETSETFDPAALDKLNTQQAYARLDQLAEQNPELFQAIIEPALEQLNTQGREFGAFDLDKLREKGFVDEGRRRLSGIQRAAAQMQVDQLKASLGVPENRSLSSVDPFLRQVLSPAELMHAYGLERITGNQLSQNAPLSGLKDPTASYNRGTGLLEDARRETQQVLESAPMLGLGLDQARDALGMDASNYQHHLQREYNRLHSPMRYGGYDVAGAVFDPLDPVALVTLGAGRAAGVARAARNSGPAASRAAKWRNRGLQFTGATAGDVAMGFGGLYDNTLPSEATPNGYTGWRPDDLTDAYRKQYGPQVQAGNTLERASAPSLYNFWQDRQ